jgi:pyruvate/2-oxoacid:ferredoxin oxidoreductase beta subunit
MLTTNKKANPTGSRRLKKYAKERAVKRVPFVASIEVFAIKSATKLVARTSEIGVGGCYVDALTPFGIGTAVVVKIVHDKEDFHSKARVVYSDASFGMGLKFEAVDSEQRVVLENWVAEVVLASRTR